MSSSIFIPRTTAPAADDPRYIANHHGYDGYNPFPIEGPDGSTLPNCTGYAYGRFSEEMGTNNCNIQLNNATDWFAATGDGYSRGQEPKLGAIICWQTWGGHTLGHVGIVEKIGRDSNGNITVIHVSYSAYNGARFTYRANIYPPYYKYKTDCALQGFIYNPIEFLETDYAAILAAAQRKRKKFRRLF